MKIKLNQVRLIKALQQAAKAVKTNPQMPILSSVLLKAENGEINILATDLQIGIKLKVEGEILSDGKISVPLSQFYEYCQNLSSGDVTLEDDGTLITVTQDKSRASFSLTQAEDYPEFSPEIGESSANVKAVDFDEILKRVLVSVSADESRPVLTGLLLRRMENFELAVVGTDGYRLSLMNVAYEGDFEREMVIPAKVMSTLLKGNVKSVVGIGFDKKNNQVWFSFDDNILSLRLLQGDFPPYEKILPTGSITRIVVSKGDLLQAVKQMAVFAKFNANILRWDVGKLLKMSTQASSMGEGGVELDVEFEGEELSLAFNYRYLQEYLNSIPEGDVEILFNGQLAPVKFLSKKAEKFVHIIMPVKLQE